MPAEPPVRLDTRLIAIIDCGTVGHSMQAKGLTNKEHMALVARPILLARRLPQQWSVMSTWRAIV
jgi:hypothetical protein